MTSWQLVSNDGDDTPAHPVTVAADIVRQLNDQLTIVLMKLDRLARQSLDENGRTELAQAEAAVRTAGRLVQSIVEPAGAPGTVPG